MVSAAAINAGELFTAENLTVKRPGSGLSPMRYWELLNRKAGRDFTADEMVCP